MDEFGNVLNWPEHFFGDEMGGHRATSQGCYREAEEEQSFFGASQMSLPAKCVVDTNVPILANLATQPDPGSDFPGTCVEACVDAVEHVMRTPWLDSRFG